MAEEKAAEEKADGGKAEEEVEEGCWSDSDEEVANCSGCAVSSSLGSWRKPEQVLNEKKKIVQKPKVFVIDCLFLFHLAVTKDRHIRHMPRW